MSKQTEFRIYSKRLAHQLCRQGYQMLRSEINNYKPWLLVYIFSYSAELEKEVMQYQEKMRKENENA